MRALKELGEVGVLHAAQSRYKQRHHYHFFLEMSRVIVLLPCEDPHMPLYLLAADESRSQHTTTSPCMLTQISRCSLFLDLRLTDYIRKVYVLRWLIC